MWSWGALFYPAGVEVPSDALGFGQSMQNIFVEAAHDGSSVLCLATPFVTVLPLIHR